jgi:hypothetical protein
VSAADDKIGVKQSFAGSSGNLMAVGLKSGIFVSFVDE